MVYSGVLNVRDGLVIADRFNRTFLQARRGQRVAIRLTE